MGIYPFLSVAHASGAGFEKDQKSGSKACIASTLSSKPPLQSTSALPSLTSPLSTPTWVYLILSQNQSSLYWRLWYAKNSHFSGHSDCHWIGTLPTLWQSHCPGYWELGFLDNRPKIMPLLTLRIICRHFQSYGRSHLGTVKMINRRWKMEVVTGVEFLIIVVPLPMNARRGYTSWGVWLLSTNDSLLGHISFEP